MWNCCADPRDRILRWRVSPGVRTCARVCRWKLAAYQLLMLALVGLAPALYPASAQAADKYRAFYYNDKGELLQVEQVPDSAVPTRFLQDPLVEQVPQIKSDTHEKISGTNVPMSKFATIAVYYTYDGAEPALGTANVRVRPVKIEDLQFAPGRIIATCLARSGSDPCSYPKRCHCQTGTCCCW
jgi:hypothetical protein